jgi:hypothetical protein
MSNVSLSFPLLLGRGAGSSFQMPLALVKSSSVGPGDGGGDGNSWGAPFSGGSSVVIARRRQAVQRADDGLGREGLGGWAAADAISTHQHAVEAPRLALPDGFRTSSSGVANWMHFTRKHKLWCSIRMDVHRYTRMFSKQMLCHVLTKKERRKTKVNEIESKIVCPCTTQPHALLVEKPLRTYCPDAP